MNILMAFLGLGFLIFIHELGHYWVGRSTGIRVEQFAIGFGPAIVSYTRKGIAYRINWIPLGGYVKFLGEDTAEGLDAPDSFQNRPIWARFFTLIAGVTMNIIGAMVLLTTVHTFYGTPVDNKFVIQAVQPGSPAQAAGFLPGDELLKANGIVIDSTGKLSQVITTSKLPSVAIEVKRKNTLLPITVTPGADHKIGVTPAQLFEKDPNFLHNVRRGIVDTGNQLVMIVEGLKQLVTGGVALNQVSGPVEIIKITGQASQSGWQNYFFVLSFLSVNLAVLNLLPLPALDGGRIVFLVLELLRRGKRIPLEKEASINFIGLMFLFALMIIVTFKDVTHLFS